MGRPKWNVVCVTGQIPTRLKRGTLSAWWDVYVTMTIMTRWWLYGILCMYVTHTYNGLSDGFSPFIFIITKNLIQPIESCDFCNLTAGCNWQFTRRLLSSYRPTKTTGVRHLTSFMIPKESSGEQVWSSLDGVQCDERRVCLRPLAATITVGPPNFMHECDWCSHTWNSCWRVDV